MFVLPLFVLVHREDPLLRRLASALLVLLVRYPASWELLLSGTLTLRLLIFLFSFSTCRTIFYSRDVFYREEQLGSLFYPLLELSLLSPDKEIPSSSYQNPFLLIALLSEALAGDKKEELSTLLTITNSHSELPYCYEYCYHHLKILHITLNSLRG